MLLTHFTLKRAVTAQNSVEPKNIYFENEYLLFFFKFDQIVYVLQKKFYEITNEESGRFFQINFRAFFPHLPLLRNLFTLKLFCIFIRCSWFLCETCTDRDVYKWYKYKGVTAGVLGILHFPRTFQQLSGSSCAVSVSW